MSLRKLPWASLAVLALTAGAASAAPVTNTFALTADDGTTAEGSFTYDDALLGSGFEVLFPSDGLTIEMSVFGQSYSEINDAEYPGFPQLAFIDFVPAVLDFFLVHGLMGVDFPDPTVVAVATTFLVENGAGADYEGPLFIETAPLPSSVWLFALGLLGLPRLRRIGCGDAIGCRPAYLQFAR